MENLTKPKLVFFQWKHGDTAKFVQLHMQLHVKCLANFFEVTVINQDCDYQEICDRYQPDITLFESGVKHINSERIQIKNTSAYPEIPKVGFHNGDSWCDCRAGFLSDMEHWGIETFFSLCVTTPEHTPDIADHLFVWPNFIDPDMCRDYKESKVIPVLFTGHMYDLYPWRQKIHKIISQHYPSLSCPHYGYGNRPTSRMMYGERYARTINASWFVPTCGTVVKEVVRKHFEIPASKSCLVTEKSPALEAAGFIDMQNCVFVDEHDVLDKLDYLFQNPDEYEKIINAGYELVHSRHTLKQRNQIFQWFNLSKKIQPNQKIVQINPFQPLIILDKASGINNSYITCDGLVVDLLRQGDKKLWAGKYEEAETLYIRCLNYTLWMPEPKLRLGLCNLYKGKPEIALDWIVQPIKNSLEVYKALDPDPVEWAYFIICLLCQGKLNEAISRASQFPLLHHPELERTRWITNILKTSGNTYILPPSNPLKSRYSLHQLPNKNLDEWVENISLILEKCQQSKLAGVLKKYISSEIRYLKQPNTSKNIIKRLNENIFRRNVFSKNWSYFENQDKLRPQSIVALEKFSFRLKLQGIQCLHHLESQFGYFLPYRFSKMRNDDFFAAIKKMAREENINTALIIGASSGEGSTEAFLTGIKENKNNTVVFCINASTPGFLKLQQRYARDARVNFYDVSYSVKESSSGAIDHIIQTIQNENGINGFDTLLINNYPLSFDVELKDYFGAKFIMLDAINTYLNLRNHHTLIANSNYVPVINNPTLRNGFAIFQKVNSEVIHSPIY
ncbi:hypothetical protein NUACC21_49770 [Scytonema sp. NUACC21]